MRTISFRRFLASFLIAVLSPVAALAASVSETVTAPDDAAVSRADFLRAGVQLLKVPTKRDCELGSFQRPVPIHLKPTMCAAKEKGALAIFGAELGWARGITRGEALTVLMKLQGMKPAKTGVSFTDLRQGGEERSAAWLAVEKGWMEPLRTNFFGVDRLLTGRDARLLLRKVIGETEPPARAVSPRNTTDDTAPVPTVRVQFRPAKASIPNDDLLETIWQLLKQQYLYTEKIDDEKASYSAAEALVESLDDPYTSFMRPVDSQEFRTQLEGEVSGIGAQVEHKDGVLTIVSPIGGSPAEQAGLKAADEILAVDGVSLSGMDFLQAVHRVRGPKGSTVVLTIRRNGNEMTVRVTRDTVRVPEISITFQGRIAIVKLVQFGETTERELRQLLTQVQNEQPSGLVLDLRNNPGGLLHAAEIVLSNFLPQGSVIANINRRDESYKERTADPPTIAASVPMVVIVNEGSASASEIVAGALQDAGRAKVVGKKTFGKGTVQQVLEFRDGSSMKMTIAEWLTPKGRAINEAGILPDIDVEATGTRDEQLLRAIDLLR